MEAIGRSPRGGIMLCKITLREEMYSQHRRSAPVREVPSDLAWARRSQGDHLALARELAQAPILLEQDAISRLRFQSFGASGLFGCLREDGLNLASPPWIVRDHVDDLFPSPCAGGRS